MMMVQNSKVREYVRAHCRPQCSMLYVLRSKPPAVGALAIVLYIRLVLSDVVVIRIEHLVHLDDALRGRRKMFGAKGKYCIVVVIVISPAMFGLKFNRPW